VAPTKRKESPVISIEHSQIRILYKRKAMPNLELLSFFCSNLQSKHVNFRKCGDQNPQTSISYSYYFIPQSASNCNCSEVYSLYSNHFKKHSELQWIQNLKMNAFNPFFTNLGDHTALPKANMSHKKRDYLKRKLIFQPPAPSKGCQMVPKGYHVSL